MRCVLIPWRGTSVRRPIDHESELLGFSNAAGLTTTATIDDDELPTCISEQRMQKQMMKRLIRNGKYLRK